MFMCRRLLRYINGEAKKPVKPEREDATLLEKYNIELDNWTFLNEVARLTIMGSIPEHLQIEALSIKSAAKVWTTICGRFDNQSEMVQADILVQMHHTRCPDDGDPRETIKALQRLHAKYASAGGVLDSAQFTAIILTAMPESFWPMLHSLVATNRVMNRKLTPTDIVNHITEAAQHNAIFNERKTGDAALFTKRSRPSHSHIDKSKSTCNNCGKKGHWKDDCWSKGGGKEGEKPKGSGRRKKKESANTAAGSSSQIPDEHAFTTVEHSLMISTPTDIPRVIDSGATSHFESNKANFANFRIIVPRPINTADGRVIHATGMGDVRIKVPNQSGQTDITLKDTLYVPDMSTLLISVAKMTKAGYKVTFANKCIHIVDPKGSELFSVPETDGLYIVPTIHQPEEHAKIALTPNQLHECLGHISYISAK